MSHDDMLITRGGGGGLEPLQRAHMTFFGGQNVLFFLLFVMPFEFQELYVFFYVGSALFKPGVKERLLCC